MLQATNKEWKKSLIKAASKSSLNSSKTDLMEHNNKQQKLPLKQQEFKELTTEAAKTKTKKT